MDNRAVSANLLPMPNYFASTIRAEMKRRRISNETIAERMGVHPVTVSKLLNGKMKFTEEWIRRFAEAMDTTVAALGEDVPTERARVPLAPQVAGQNLPVYGLAAGSVMGNLTMTNDPVEYVGRPAALAAVRDAYALIVTGSSMEPRYFAGEVIFINPNRPPRAGDHVVIQEALDGGTRVSIKRFEKMTETHVITTQYNPLAEVKFSRQQIIALHRVLTPNEVAGV